ncbi:MAG: cytochrome c3 family protein [Planctomycetes bacterium]|nr:cytochrome c3 family protein [Planctomycetota bacterium]MBL7038048.1 cytochrome c3 family protein [Pirellulaceae bacterium]
MKYAAPIMLLAAVVIVIFACLAGFSGGDKEAHAAPPLSLEGLLNEKLPDAPKEKVEVKADNSACYVCHANYDGEKLALIHAIDDVGCIECHGESLAHRDDEDNVTPPDVMYPADRIEEKCAECHDEHDVSAREVITRWQKRCPKKTNPSELVCTDCHGQHRLKLRTVRWDKKTRKLIIRKEETAKATSDAAETKTDSGE